MFNELKKYFISSKSRDRLNRGIVELEERANQVPGLKDIIAKQSDLLVRKDDLIEKYKQLESAFDLKNRACEAQRDALFTIIENIRDLVVKLESDGDIASVRRELNMLSSLLKAFNRD